GEKDVVISSDAKLEIMNVNSEVQAWGNEIILETDKSAVCPDITGNGLDFYYPTYLVDGDTPNMADVGSYRKLTESNASQYMVTLRIKFRTSDAISVYLGQKSYVKPKSTEYRGEGVRKSAFGDFSADYIAGCSRVAFVGIEDDAEVLKSVWIPNDTYQVAYEENSDNALFYTSGTREEAYGYHTVEENMVVAKTYTGEDYANANVMVGNKNLATEATSSVAPMINNSKALLTFSGESVEEKELIIRMWFEGTDREADKALAGGQVLYNFNFVGISKTNVSNTQMQKLSTINCRQDGYLYFGEEETIATNLLYSTNGIDWENYGGLGGVTFNESCTIYLKTTETSDLKSSEAYKLEIVK
ncbi:MAG: hypothetical protein IKV38_00520, partial [Clostridia bacterium]|nr:hypothetical protein [Clostridia bacterium]